ncbi:DUF4184 family protein [Povalibacter sp.]|uniref:DUF4184 family protein n=1 Tax=Povalibacter sp. TaxID=1962978 RepID=UPI002F3FDB4B
MPFTISHTAAVLPFAHFLRRWRLLSAAVIGAMVPDSTVFLFHVLSRDMTHSKVGLFTFCLPVGLVWYWIFQLHIKPATYELMPDRLYLAWSKDAPSPSLLSLRQWAFAALGVLLGAFTHLVWDAFTHEGARGVRMLSVFDDLGLTAAGNSHAWVGVAQHVSSAVGLLFVIGFVWRDVHRAQYHDAPLTRRLTAQQRHRWFAIYVATAVIVSIGSLLVLTDGRPLQAPPMWMLSSAAIGSLWGLAASLLLVSGLIRWRLAHPR